MFEKDSACSKVINQITQKANEDEGITDEEKEKLRKKRQAEIMKKFAAQQQV